MKINVNEAEFIETCLSSKTMAEAARRLNMHFNTFKKYALKFNCYVANASHKGVKTGPRQDRISTDDILLGKYPDYQTYKLKLRLLREGYKQDKCECCG